jgi:predicted O-methyltransferase YrrM
MKSLVLTLRYIIYFLKAQNRHDIHSPFVYRLTTTVFNKKREMKPVFEMIEQIRYKLLHDTTVISIKDYGAGFRGKRSVEKSVRYITSHSSKSRKYGLLLHRLVNYFSPQTMLELGTSVGLSAMYQASAAPAAKMFTLEGCENTASIAVKNFKDAHITNITMITGDFENTLNEVVDNSPLLDYVFLDGNHRKDPVLKYFDVCLKKKHSLSCFVIDDINWSGEMREAWKIIKAHPEVYITIDLFMLGLVFFNPEHTKQNFTIRF